MNGIKGGRKFYVVIVVIASVITVVSLAFALAILGKIQGTEWSNLAQWAISNIVAFASGYIAGNFASKITEK